MTLRRRTGGRRRLLAVALVALAAAATGCANVGLAPRVPVAQDWTTVTNPPADVVDAAHQDLKSVLGVQVVWQSDTPTPQTQSEADRILNYVVGLGANEIGIDFYFDTNGDHPTRVYGEQGITPSPYTIGLVISAAQQRGLKVVLRPLLSGANLGVAAGNWRGNIHPKSLEAWFASYYAFLQPYLVVAQEHHIAGFAIGTELDSLTSAKKQWTAMEANIKYVYSGSLTFAVNWNDWHTSGTKYQPVPHVAVDAYPPTTLGEDATVRELTAVWVKWLDRQTKANLKQTVMDEVGIAPADGAYGNPAGYGAADPVVNAGIQRNWLAAACKAAKKTHLAGMFFYVVYDTDAPGDPASLLDAARTLSFTGISDSVVKGCFATGWS